LPTPLEFYPTHAQIGADLLALQETYPDLCRVESIGQSVQGRDLWFIKITDHPDIEEAEPEFKYISTMHGNETVGTPLTLNLIHLLLESYGTDPRLTGLVNETEIWILPLMNPDGYSANPRSRFNGHGVDLNRSFPDRIADTVNTTEGREPETAAVMAFGADHSSVLSANFHTGALLVNYPYDSSAASPSPPPKPEWFSPDDDLFQRVSLAYSIHNSPMYNSPFFENGITNGISWFQVFGGMQDWNYHWLGCNEVTIELSDSFTPAESTLLGFWENNRESMLAYMEQVHIGIRGIVSDANTGSPIDAAIRVEGRDHDVFTDPDVGDYYRMVLAGTYDLTVSAEGYRPQTAAGVAVEMGMSAVVNFQLEREPTSMWILR
jgi:carboxypeptidase D